MIQGPRGKTVGLNGEVVQQYPVSWNKNSFNQKKRPEQVIPLEDDLFFLFFLLLG